MMTYLKLALLGLIALGLASCTVVGTVAEPVLGLGVKDANTTLAWVDQQVTAGRMTVEDAVIAKQCPNAVIALDTLKESLKPLPEASEGFRGVIYYGTLSRFGQGPDDLIKDHLKEIVNTCTHLVPSEKIVDALF
jgi:hypothetical protein